ncbi:TPA: hypothetical protein ACGXMH_001326 [Bacillus mobilis]|uniref:hypothetical protein n=1 Tax=Bacillus mobilis TaxID=2026190 RepID=UPI0011A46117|nr:hypothetical protein [Bacillus mobilis]MED4384986.1 hypothetical protein [Bacillus mobilis]HDX9638993.1 hypothetical protein [Bacillus mobilis]
MKSIFTSAKESLRRLDEILYLYTKPFLFPDILLISIKSIYNLLFSKRLSSALIVSKKNKLFMDIKVMTLLKYWFCFNPEDDKKFAIALANDFMDGLLKLEGKSSASQIYTTDVNKGFLLILIKKAKKMNLKINIKIIDETSKTQIHARLCIISPFHYTWIILKYLFGSQNSRELLTRIKKPIKVCKVEIHL